MDDLLQNVLDAKIKALYPAKYVQHAGQIQFEAVLPLESEPKLRQLEMYVENIKKDVVRIDQSFVRIGFWLNEIQRNHLYRYPIETGMQGYTSFFRFCEEQLGFSKTTAQRLIGINNRFCGGTHVLQKDCERFSLSQLGIMSTFKNGLEHKLTPEVSVRNMEKLYKYYSSHDWEASRETTCWEDLQAYKDEEAESQKQKAARLVKFKFEDKEATRLRQSGGGKPSKTAKEKNAYQTFDDLLLFLDQTFYKAKELAGSDETYRRELEPVLAVLQERSNALRKAKSESIFSLL